MNNEAKLPKTQAATLREIARINDSDEPAVRDNRERKGIHTAALRHLHAKGLTRTHTIELNDENGGYRTFVLVTEAGYAWLEENPEA